MKNCAIVPSVATRSGDTESNSFKSILEHAKSRLSDGAATRVLARNIYDAYVTNL